MPQKQSVPTILGLDILSNLNEKIQFLICTFGIIIFYLIYGYTQEWIFSNPGFKPFGWYLTFVQFLLYAILSKIENLVSSCSRNIEKRQSTTQLLQEKDKNEQDLSDRDHPELSESHNHSNSVSEQDNLEDPSKIPYKLYALIAFLTVGTIGCSNTSLAFLNYPTQVIFKCCKLIPVMIGGIFIQRKKYGILDFFAAVLMTIGLIFFTLADVSVEPNFDYRGILLISTALFFDATIGNVQEKTMKALKRSNTEMIYYSYLYGAGYLFIGLIVSNNFLEPFLFCLKNENGLNLYLQIFLFSLSGYIGLQFVLALVRLFSAYLAITVTTFRKALSMIVSFIFFEKPFTMQFVWSGLIAISGVVLNGLMKGKSPKQQVKLFNDVVFCFLPVLKFLVKVSEDERIGLKGEEVV